MRCSVLKEMLNTIDYDKMYRDHIGVEEITAWYVENYIPSNKIFLVNKLFFTANIFFDTGDSPKLTHW